MSKFSIALPFAVGLGVVAWIGLGFAGGSWLPLVVTAAILGFYLFGALELHRFRAATAGLRAALEQLAQPPATLDEWLARVPPALRGAVRLRVESERGALPGPALAPYLAGLLVMLGMLGTFLGMVLTFRGAVFALQGSTDLEAIRASLAEPVKGLGLAFGTSVAGVAASAMLGLMAAISRRERLRVGELLDHRVAGVLQSFSLVHQRQEGLQALQAQARALPQLVDALHATLERMDARAERLDAQLLQRHERFQQEASLAYAGFAREVGDALRQGLDAGARAAGETIPPLVERTMAQLAEQSRALHEQLAGAGQAQADAVARAFGERSAALLADAQELLRARQESEARWLEAQGQRMDRIAGLWGTELAALRQQEEHRGQAAVDRLDALQASVAQQLAALGAALESPLARVLQTAAEVPQAAAGVLAQLREAVGQVAQREDVALQDRAQLLARMDALLQSVNAAVGEQRAATEALLASASSMLAQAGGRFAQELEAQAGQAADSAAHLAAGAVELASLTEGFGRAVELFQASNDKAIDSLARVQASLERATARSDEQLAYYVAQAREVIDLSIASQQGVVEQLRALKRRQGAELADAVAP